MNTFYCHFSNPNRTENGPFGAPIRLEPNGNLRETS